MHAFRLTISDSAINIHTRVWFFISIPLLVRFVLNIRNTDNGRRLPGVLSGVVDGLAAFLERQEQADSRCLLRCID